MRQTIRFQTNQLAFGSLIRHITSLYPMPIFQIFSLYGSNAFYQIIHCFVTRSMRRIVLLLRTQNCVRWPIGTPRAIPTRINSSLRMAWQKPSLKAAES